MQNKRILMLVGDFVEDYEVMVPQQILLMLGHEVHSVCPGKKAGDFVATSVHDFEGHQTYSEKPGHRFALNATFDEVRSDNYDGLIIPGGRSPEYLRLNNRVLDLVRKFAAEEKAIGAVCHGPQVLAAAGVLKGRECTAYPALRPDMVMAGARWEEPNLTLDSVHVDGFIVTAPAWPAQYAFMREFLRIVGSAVEVA